MATFEVNTLVDEADYGATIFVPNVGYIPFGPPVSLREAIKLANETDGADTITFASNLDGAIQLVVGKITITDEVTINGDGRITVTGDKDGDDVTTEGGFTDVAASGGSRLDDNSRIFNASADLTIDGLTLTGGRTTGSLKDGGAVFVNGVLTVTNSTISTISTISGNSTAGDRADGGGARSDGALTVENSILLGNVALNASADEEFEYAGGIRQTTGRSRSQAPTSSARTASPLT